MLRALARLSEDGKRIEVIFPYSKPGLRAIKAVPGASWVPSKRLWTVSLSLTSGRRLREEFGAGLVIDERLQRWGHAEIRRQRKQRLMARATDAHLQRLPRVMPELADMLDARPYQRADIERMAAGNVLNANEPGTGKTIEVIGTVAEAGLLDRPALTLAPVRSIENTWAAELRRVKYPHPVLASEDGKVRAGHLVEAAQLAAAGEPFWLVTNPEHVRVKPVDPKAKPQPPIAVRDPVSGDPFWAPKPELFAVDWGQVSVDEFHKFGLTNTRSQFGLACRLLQGDRMILASGTPMGGKYKRLWAALNWLHPAEYGSWWRWAEQWLIIRDNGFGKVVLDEIQPGREEDFRAAHAHHFLRRTKLTDLPGCPAKVHRLVECGMTTQQERQYRSFEQEAELRISGRRVTGHGILAEWTRLRAFANATQRTIAAPERGAGRVRLASTADSGKLPYLLDALDEAGVRKSSPEPGARAIVGSMDKSYVRILTAYLNEHGIRADALTGDTKDSRPLVRRFQSADVKPYVIVMTIQTGGVSLNLERAGSIHAMDESWDPDQMTQFFDRGDRGTRTTPLLCFTYRTRDTIQEYVAQVAEGKEINNHNVLKVAPRVRALSRASRTESQSL